MSYWRRGNKTLCLYALIMFGLSTLVPSEAQASGVVTVEDLTPPFTVGIVGQGENALTGSLWSLSLGLEYFCHSANVSGSLASNGSGSATITFEFCLAQGVSGGSLTGTACAIPNVVAKVKALVILHSGNSKLTLNESGGAEHAIGTGSPYLLLTPENGLTFATLLVHVECALPESISIKGCVVAKLVTVGHQVRHLISTKSMLELFGCTLTSGNSEAHLNIDGLIELSGSHAGLRWGMGEPEPAPGEGNGEVFVLDKFDELLQPSIVKFKVDDHNALGGSRLILGLNMEIFCHEMHGIGSMSSTGHLVLRLFLEKCLTQGISAGGLTGAVCEIPSIEGKYLGLVVLHSGGVALTTAQHSAGTGEPYILFTPESNLTFEKILNHTECAIPENANVKGCFVAKLVTTGHHVTHLFTTKEMSALFGCKLSYGANTMHASSDALITLTGGHAGLEWGLK